MKFDYFFLKTDKKRRRRKSFDKNVPQDSEARQEIQDMAKGMADAIKTTLQERTGKGKLITQENITLFDLYKQEKINERLNRQIIELLKDSIGHAASADITFPFSLPLKTRSDVEGCEEYITDDTNYQTLVSFFCCTIVSIFLIFHFVYRWILSKTS